MAVLSKIPETLGSKKAVAKKADVEAWLKDNSEWLKAVLDKHKKWITDAEIEKYQAAYDGQLESIEARDKARGDDTNYKLVANYSQLIIDTVTDYMTGKMPVWTVEDPEQDDGDTKEADILTEYRKKITKLLGKDRTRRVLAEQLRQGSIAGYSTIIGWVDDKGRIKYDEFPVQEVIPVYDTRGVLRYVIRKYEVTDLENNKRVKVEVYDERYIYYAVANEAEDAFTYDEDEAPTGNPVEHKAGRIPVSVYINGTAAKYSTRVQRAGTSDLGNGVFTLLEAYSAGLSDKANIADYLQDQYLLLKGVDTDEKEVLKMRKARAIALKSKESDASFIAQSQEDKTVENYLNRLENTIYDTTFTPKLNKLEGATATEIKMKYAALDIKAGKKEIYFVEAIRQLIEVLTDLLNAELLISKGVADPYSILSNPEIAAARDDLYSAEWVKFSLVRNLPQNYKEIADIVAELADKIPDRYLYELLWFIDDPVKALEEMKQQRKDSLTNNMAAMYGSDFTNTDTSGTEDNTDNDNGTEGQGQ